MRAKTLVVGLALSATACVGVGRRTQSPDVPGTRPGDPATPAGLKPNDGSSKLIAQQKPVDGKVAPATLIAKDGTRCEVTEAKFRETSIGEKVVCGWY